MILIIEYIKEDEYDVEFKSNSLYFYTNLLLDTKIWTSDLGVYKESDDGESTIINVMNIGKRVWRI